MNFTQLQERVRAELLRRIERGSLSASLLAKRAKMGQSHVSNFLHGRRNISMPTLDRILDALHLEVADLLPPRREGATVFNNQWGEAGRVPLVSTHTAMHEPFLRPSNIHQIIALPADSLAGLLVRCPPARHQWERFVAVHITPKEAQGMEPLITPNTILVIDRHYTVFQPYHEGPENLHATLYAAIAGWGTSARLVIRYAQSEAGRVILRRHQAGFPAEVLQIPPEHTPTDLIAGRVALTLNTL
jgi:transcriptional regulator with XRE-family HTH domain